MSQEEIKPGYIRVSDLIKPYVDFSHIDPEVLSRKARIGTEVHEAIAAHYTGDFFPISPEADVYLPAFKSAIKSDVEILNETPVVLEKRLYSTKMGFTGQIDALFKSKLGSYHLVDFKTSYAAQNASWRLQLTFYAMLLSENSICDEPVCSVLHLKKNGSFSLIDLSPTAESYKLCRALVWLNRYFASSAK